MRGAGHNQTIHADNSDPVYLWRFVADLTSAAVRDTDSVARRPGEYSVAILLPQSDAQGGEIVIERLNARLEIEKLEIAGSEPVIAKFNHKAVTFPADGTTAAELLTAIQAER